MGKFGELMLAALVSSGVIAAILAIVFRRYMERVVNQEREQYDKRLKDFHVSFDWKQKSVAELLGPLYVQFDRTLRAVKRYEANNLYLEAKVLKDGNEKIRNMLIEKAYLIPQDLFEDANELIAHYDVWLELFYKYREQQGASDEKPFIFVDRQHAFPKKAEENFKKRFKDMWSELYAPKG